MSTFTIHFIFIFWISTCNSERIRYIITEHPSVTFYDKKFVSFVNLTSRRYGRGDPFYYVGVNFDSVYEMHNNLSVDISFDEFLSIGRYRRGYLQMHAKLCDFIEKDVVFGTAIRQGKFKGTCPFPAGIYNLSNMTIPLRHIPNNFIFTKGRIYLNVTVTATKNLVVSARINMEIKKGHINKKNWVDETT